MDSTDRGCNDAFFTWSNLLFALVLLLVIWLVHCCVMGATRYSLRLTLQEQVRVSGVVRMSREAVPLVHTVTHRLGETSGGSRGIGRLEYDPGAGGACYEVFIPASEVRAETSARHWLTLAQRHSEVIAVSIEPPVGWRVRPEQRIIRGPTAAAHFTVERDEQ